MADPQAESDPQSESDAESFTSTLPSDEEFEVELEREDFTSLFDGEENEESEESNSECELSEAERLRDAWAKIKTKLNNGQSICTGAKKTRRDVPLGIKLFAVARSDSISFAQLQLEVFVKSRGLAMLQTRKQFAKWKDAVHDGTTYSRKRKRVHCSGRPQSKLALSLAATRTASRMTTAQC